MKIRIIGAGVSGLTTARLFIEEKHDVFLFVRESSLEGNWLLFYYPNLSLQSTSHQYHFKNFPFRGGGRRTSHGRPSFEYAEEYHLNEKIL
jgi:cation diffusion facilitator CzcD-associated flavoprotein CzcO